MDRSSENEVVNQTLWPKQTAQLIAVWNVVEGTSLAVVTVVGFLINLFIVAAILSSRQLRRRFTDVLCCHLAVVGLVWCALLLPVNVTAAFTSGWPLRSGGSSGGLFCDAHGYVQAAMVHVMVWTIAILARNKYRTIVAPLKHVSAITWQRVVAILAFTWSTGLILACIPFISGSGVGNYVYGHAIVACVYEPSLTVDNGTPTVLSLIYTLAVVIVGFLLPVCVTGHSYFRIYHIARWHRKRIAVMSAVVHVITLSVGVPMSGQGLSDVHRTPGNRNAPSVETTRIRDRKTSRNVLAFVVALILCYAPHYTLVAVALVVRRSPYPPYSSSTPQLPVAVEALACLVVLASPAINGFVYGVRNRAMLRAFRSFIRPPTLAERLSRHLVSNV